MTQLFRLRPSAQWKDLYIDGTAYLDAAEIDSLSLASGATCTAILDEDDMNLTVTALVTQQSIKKYVDDQIDAIDLDFQGDSGGALSIDLDSEVLTIAGELGYRLLVRVTV